MNTKEAEVLCNVLIVHLQRYSARTLQKSDAHEPGGAKAMLSTREDLLVALEVESPCLSLSLPFASCVLFELLCWKTGRFNCKSCECQLVLQGGSGFGCTDRHSQALNHASYP